MSALRRAGVVLLVALLFGLAPRVRAWESACTDSSLDPTAADSECPTWDLAKSPWRARFGRDEHRALLEEAMARLGLPAELRQDFEIAFYAQDQFRNPPLSAPWSLVNKVIRVTRSIAEFAQLPDYGYSLFDYATAFKTCPPNKGVSGEDCHEYTGHLGALNSTHFPPQSRNAHGRYHELAKLRALACADMATRLEGHARFGEYLLECQREALIFEAIAQHFLSDAWSVGHMWERWGSPRLEDFRGETDDERLVNARIVGAVTGLIHGSESLTGNHDPMCFPDDDVTFMWRGAEQKGAGDLHWMNVRDEKRYRAQWDGLISCSTASLDEVWRMANGQPINVVMPGDCFEQRATNRAMWKGAQMSTLTPSALHLFLGGHVVERRELAETLQNMMVALRVASKDASATKMASGELLPLLGTQANSKYLRPPDYWDSAEAHLTSADSEQDQLNHSVAIPRMFHRAHALDWCRSAHLDTLQNLRRRALARAASDSASAESSAEVKLCVEMVRRHLHVVSNGDLAVAANGDSTCTITQEDVVVSAAPRERAPLCALLDSDALKVGLIVPPGRLAAPIEEHALAWCLQPDCDVCGAACTYKTEALGCSPGAAGSCVAVCRTSYLLASGEGICSDAATMLEDCRHSHAALALGCTTSDSQKDQATCAPYAAALTECKAVRDRRNPDQVDAGAPITGDTPAAYCEAACAFKTDELGCANPVGTCAPLCVAAHNAAVLRGTCTSTALALEACRYSKPALALGCLASEADKDTTVCASEKAADVACRGQ